jgi:5,10-methenyltetrahydromethanopterin hydrogenase
MAKIVMTLESVLIAGSHFDANTLVNCDDSDAAQLISIKRAREATPEEVKEAREKAKKNDVAKQAPKPIGAEDTEKRNRRRQRRCRKRSRRQGRQDR